jgi:hypothetical protein
MRRIAFPVRPKLSGWSPDQPQKEKPLMTKEEKGKSLRKKKKMTFMLLEVRDSFQHPGASAKYSHVTVPAETSVDLGIVYRKPHVPSALSQLLAIEICDYIVWATHFVSGSPTAKTRTPHLTRLSPVMSISGSHIPYLTVPMSRVYLVPGVQ